MSSAPDIIDLSDIWQAVRKKQHEIASSALAAWKEKKRAIDEKQPSPAPVELKASSLTPQKQITEILIKAEIEPFSMFDEEPAIFKQTDAQTTTKKHPDVKTKPARKGLLLNLTDEFLNVATASGIAATLLMQTSPVQTLLPKIEFGADITHYVCGEQVRIRSGPTDKSDIIREVNSGESLQVIGSQGNWAEIVYEEDTAFISFSNIFPVEKQRCLRRKMRSGHE